MVKGNFRSVMPGNRILIMKERDSNELVSTRRSQAAENGRDSRHKDKTTVESLSVICKD
jgi:hypothetical protein